MSYLRLAMGMMTLTNPYSDLEDFRPRVGKRTGTIIPVRTERKIGRNERCPCGSGKKYKHCCALAKEKEL